METEQGVSQHTGAGERPSTGFWGLPEAGAVKGRPEEPQSWAPELRRNGQVDSGEGWGLWNRRVGGGPLPAATPRHRKAAPRHCAGGKK